VWNYIETDAYNSISLHDCRSDDIKIEGDKLIVNFPDGFWITPVGEYIDRDCPLKTGPSQLCFYGLGTESVIDAIDLFKTIYLFRKPILCRRIRIEPDAFLKLVNDGKHELEFLFEFHRPGNGLYQCWLWKKNCGVEAECQFEITAKSIEYRWNEILPDREW
jgi:hypothetical protein